MVALKEALPFLLLDLESALVHIGRGDVLAQLRVATIQRWSYDELADAAYLHFTAQERDAVGSSGEIVSVYDELGINLETDSRGCLTGMEILGGRPIIAQLEQGNQP